MIAAITMMFAFLKTLVQFLYKSKCETYSLCWGLFKSTRNVAAEVGLDQAELEHQAAPAAIE
jgi:hypothetical protein